jgi:uncharacterized protein YbjT (DUF2867 family)
MTHQQSVIIAGSTGLIGSLLVEIALQHDQIAYVVSLSRNPLEHSDNLRRKSKLIQIVDNNLQIDEALLPTVKPSIGFITLGSTKKQAGNKATLKLIDVTLAVNVAKGMQKAGVRSIYVVSCIGASLTAFSHYLRCKGEMEKGIEALSFERTVFIQPGPLAGQRKTPRSDERLLQGFMKLLNPIMKGWLLNYKPIEADIVANAMLYFAFQTGQEQVVQRTTSQALFALKTELAS